MNISIDPQAFLKEVKDRLVKPGNHNPATDRQPAPAGNGQPVIDQVIKDLKARVFVGIQKYGTPLKTHNGRDALVDAYQEALDLCMYLKQEIMERENG